MVMSMKLNLVISNSNPSHKVTAQYPATSATEERCYLRRAQYPEFVIFTLLFHRVEFSIYCYYRVDATDEQERVPQRHQPIPVFFVVSAAI